MYISNIKKDYGKSIKVLKYRKSVELSAPVCKIHQATSCPICWVRSVSPVPSSSSLQRTKSVITDISLANDFDLFVTFTINPDKIDSFDIPLVKSKVSKWLNNAKSNHNSLNFSPQLEYLVIPELHKSGRIHFHALFKNYQGSLLDSKKSQNGKVIYNLEQFKYGFTTATKIESIEKTSNYIQKYIKKDMLKIGNKKRYFASKGLKKPLKTYNINMQKEVYSRPLFITHQHTQHATTTNKSTGELVEFEQFTIYKLIK